MIKLTPDWFFLEDSDRNALSTLLHLDFDEVVMVSRNRLVCFLAMADRVSKDSSLSVAAILDQLVTVQLH